MKVSMRRERCGGRGETRGACRRELRGCGEEHAGAYGGWEGGEIGEESGAEGVVGLFGTDVG